MTCECVLCDECRGTGRVWYSFSGRYLGNKRCDDLDSLDSCAQCNGSGFSEICDKCRQEQYDDNDY
jgi:hypothetical protein